MSKVYISNQHGYLGKAITRVLETAEQDYTILEQEEATEFDHVASEAEIVILNTHDGLEDAVDAIKALEKEDWEGEKTLILVSSLHTWSATTTQDLFDALEEDEEAHEEVLEEGTLAASRYSRRKPGASFIVHHRLEEQVVGMAHDRLSTCVISSGIPYGCGESLLEGLFRTAWLGGVCRVPALVHRNPSQVPTIHVVDLAKAVVAAASDVPASQPYIVAVDRSQCSLTDLVAAVQGEFGKTSDPLSRVELLDDAASAQLLLEDPSWLPLSQLQLCFTEESRNGVGALIETGPTGWECEEGLPANIRRVAAEFVESRGLRPVRVSLLGAPGSEPDRFAQVLAKKYYLPLVQEPQQLVLEFFNTLRERKSAEGEGVGEDAAEDSEAEAEEDFSGLSIAAQQKKNEDDLLEKLLSVTQDGKKMDLIAGATLAEAMKVYLSQPQYSNSGYILLNWPRTNTEAEEFFTLPKSEDEDQDESENFEEEEAEEEEEETSESEEAGDESQEPEVPKIKLTRIRWNPLTQPTSVIVLDAENQVLLEKAVKEQNLAEKEFEKNLKKFRDTKDSFMDGNWFQDKDIISQDILLKPEVVPALCTPEITELDEDGKPVDQDVEVPITQSDIDRIIADNRVAKREFQDSLYRHIERSGAAFNYHPTPEEAEQIRIEEENEKMCTEFEEEKSIVAQEKQVEADRLAEEKNALEQLDSEAEEDEIQLQERSKPLRDYLMKHVMPVLSKGLLECCKDQPDDPIDYLAEYLFKNKLETSRAPNSA